MAIYQPSTGETPLSGDPNSFQWGQGQWQGYGGDQKAAEFYAWKDFAQQFGRNPTASELASLAPAYLSGDRNIANTSAGKAAVAQYYQAQANTPANAYAREQAGYAEKAPQYYGSIDQMFQGTLGRAATDAERKHFGSLLASGQVDEYGIGQFLQALPENVQQQDKKFREGLSADLQKQDAQYFNEQLMPGIQSAFANQGRDPRSSGFASALAQAGTQQNRQRETFLSNLSANQYAGSQGLAQRDYLNTYGANQSLQDYSRQRAAQMQDAYQNRVNDISDYNTQARAYADYLARYGKRSKTAGLGSLLGGLAGAGLGAYFGGPAGSKAGSYLGYSMGSGAGGYAEGLF